MPGSRVHSLSFAPARARPAETYITSSDAEGPVPRTLAASRRGHRLAFSNGIIVLLLVDNYDLATIAAIRYAKSLHPSAPAGGHEAAPAGRATVQGRLHAAEVRPGKHHTMLACEVADSTGAGGRPTMINPSYELLR